MANGTIETRSIDHLHEVLRHYKDKNGQEGQRARPPVHLLIGAGCSISAKIPGAAGIVAAIQQKFPSFHAEACGQCNGAPSYGDCMAALRHDLARDLIADYCANAIINPAHFVIATLLAEGLVDRVYTTNFDPLVSRAYGLTARDPRRHRDLAIYDLAMANDIRPELVSNPCVLHLHGQYAGFTLLHENDALKEQKRRMEPLFAEREVQSALWIAVGYSGDSDPVLDLLRPIKQFQHGFYWVGYNDSPPSPNAQAFLENTRQTFLIKGYDADRFFVTLGGRLGIYPPRIVDKPFHHLKDQFDFFADLMFPTGDVDKELIDERKQQIEAAINEHESGKADAGKLQKLVFAGNHDAAIAAFEQDQQLDDEAKHWAARAYFGKGVELGKAANKATGADAEDLYRQASEKFAEAIRLKPDYPEAFNNWGNALNELGRTATGEEAAELYQQACEKCAEATRLNPDYPAAFINWGNALSGLARAATGADAKDLYRQACEKYAEAVRLKPDYQEAFYNWGSTLLSGFHRATDGERADLLAQAEILLRKATALDPVRVYNYACLCALQGGEDRARRWLSRAVRGENAPSRDHVENDPDWAAWRNRDWFQDILAELK